MTRVRQLFDLQELDVTITLHSSETQKLENHLKESPALLAARQEVEEKVNALKEIQKEQHDLETEAADLRAKIKPLQQKLSGGSVKNPKELVNLQADLKQQQAVLTQKEDRLLEMMEEIEKANSAVEQVRSRVQTLEKAWEEAKVKATAKLEEEKKVLEQLGQKRQVMVSQLDQGMVKLYDSLKARKGKALALVERGMCMGCRVTLPMSLIQKARASYTDPVFCCNCERILLVG